MSVCSSKSHTKASEPPPPRVVAHDSDHPLSKYQRPPAPPEVISAPSDYPVPPEEVAFHPSLTSRPAWNVFSLDRQLHNTTAVFLVSHTKAEFDRNCPFSQVYVVVIE
jgi:hypothetical protein